MDVDVTGRVADVRRHLIDHPLASSTSGVAAGGPLVVSPRTSWLAARNAAGLAGIVIDNDLKYFLILLQYIELLQIYDVTHKR